MSNIGKKFFQKLQAGDYNKNKQPAKKPQQDNSKAARDARRAKRLAKRKKQGVSKYGQTY